MIITELIGTMVASGCFIGIAICAADIIKPDEKFAGQIRLVFSLIFMLVFFAPFIKNDSVNIFANTSESETDFSVAAMSEAIDLEMRSAVESNIESSLSGLLRENKIMFEEISVNVNIDDCSSIIINEVRITSEQFDKAEQLLRNELGKDVIICEGEQDEEN